MGQRISWNSKWYNFNDQPLIGWVAKWLKLLPSNPKMVSFILRKVKLIILYVILTLLVLSETQVYVSLLWLLLFYEKIIKFT